MSPQLPRRVPLAILIPAILGAVLAPVAWYNWSSSWAPELVARLPAAVSGSSDTPALGSKGDTVDDSHFHWPSADDLAGLWISSDEASRMLWAMKPGMILPRVWGLAGRRWRLRQWPAAPIPSSTTSRGVER
eukprot:TRINITY_DN1169_c0_g1_i9.p3 TRINITY_DN1169_c0_g1~~TRINITY_DN1169_c0_g1_i9.p3  ORF type:complete len:132 (+),score=7.84 TRINITY_DN1169_c0_g1_i9:556-951(+)